MTFRTSTIHKWIGICLGVFFFMWLVSGVVMVVPMKPMVPPSFNSTPDLSTVQMSPAMAAALVTGDSSATRTVDLIGIGGRAFYQVKVKGGSQHLLDALSGDVLTITPAVAESLARLALNVGEAPLLSVERVTKRTPYIFGPLPAFQVNFGDPARTVALVGERNGMVRGETRARQVRYFLTQLHTFAPIENITGRPETQEVGLWLVSGIALILVFTGYYLALPVRWRRRRGGGS